MDCVNGLWAVFLGCGPCTWAAGRVHGLFAEDSDRLLPCSAWMASLEGRALQVRRSSSEILLLT
jgi:hypothetical protein